MTGSDVTAEQKDSSASAGKGEKGKGVWRVSGKAVVAFLVLTNLPLILYTSLIHQRGAVDVTKFLYDETHFVANYNRMSVRFLMPCHSTPYYA